VVKRRPRAGCTCAARRSISGLDRVAELLDLDLDDPRTRAGLLMALRALHLLGDTLDT
jgi:hypothetical protein